MLALPSTPFLPVQSVVLGPMGETASMYMLSPKPIFSSPPISSTMPLAVPSTPMQQIHTPSCIPIAKPAVPFTPAQAKEKLPRVIRKGAWVEGRNLVVSNLPSWMNEQQLEALFQPFGRIIRAFVIVDRVTKKSKCVGFVEFASAANAKTALERKTITPVPPPGKPPCDPITISSGRRNYEHRKGDTVYIGGFGRSLTVQELVHLCIEFGPIKSAKVLSQRTHSDGVAFIQFESAESADLACHVLDGAEIKCTNDSIVQLRVRLPDEVGKVHQRKLEAAAQQQQQQHEQSDAPVSSPKTNGRDEDLPPQLLP